MAHLKLKNINKIYDNNVQAVFDFNLEIHDKEFIVFVGPSGCGKSTTLRMIAGLEDITSGELYVDGELMNDILPKDRDMSMVFQSYALYPHMTVYKNMAFGLKLRKIPSNVYDKNGKQVFTFNKEKVKELKREIVNLNKNLKKASEEESVNLISSIENLKEEIVKVKNTLDVPKIKWVHYPKEEIDRRVNNAAEILGLTDYLDRKPKALSGGQRQRVALGRSIVRDAKVFLMDEPLSNLDAKLRVQMRSEIIKLHANLGTTTIYVTHDQIEAMTMASRIVVMKDGYIQQVGTPKYIYDNPANLFVAGFIGTPPMNFINGTINEEGYFRTKNNKYQLKLPQEKFELIEKQGYINKEIILGVRPEDIYDDSDSLAKYKDSSVDIKVDVAELLGASTYIHFNLDTNNICAVVKPRTDLRLNDELKLAMDLNKCHVFDVDSKMCITITSNE